MEKALLGALLINQSAIYDCADVVHVDSFYAGKHRTIYDAMLTLYGKGEPIDVVTVAGKLSERKQLQELGGRAYLSELASSAASPGSARHYAEAVQSKFVLRSLLDAASKIGELGFQEDRDIESVLDEAQQAIFAVSNAPMLQKFTAIKEELTEAWERLENLQKHTGTLRGVASGFPALDNMLSGFQKSDLVILAARPSMGKAQPLDAKIKTLTGWKTMGELQLSDELASWDGRPSRVSGIFPQGEKQIYTITFSDGRSAECCAEHLWRVHYRSWPSPRILSTQQIIQMLERRRYQGRLWIDTPSGDFGHLENLPLDPWLLGAFLGDGKLSGSTPMFSTADAEMLQRIAAHAGDGFAISHAGKYDYRIVTVGGSHRVGVQGVVPNAIKNALTSLGLWNIRSENKFIPENYLHATRAVRLNLLRGLLDTDGWVEKWGSIRFCSSSQQLAEDVVALARSLGATCTINKKQPWYTFGGVRKSGLPSFVCNIQHSDSASLMSLGRKVSRTGNGRSRQARLTISSITPARVTEAQCITVTHPDALYITDNYIVTHNTALALDIARQSAVKHKTPVGIFSLEMSSQQLVDRMLAAQAGVNSWRLRTGKISKDDEYERLQAGIAELSDAPIYIDDKAGNTVLSIRSVARRMKMEKGLAMVIVDYLQLITPATTGSNISVVQQVTEVSRALKGMARELDVPVIALSQLSRAVEQRRGRPRLSDLRDSGSIEQDADVVMFIHREDMMGSRGIDEKNNVAEILIEKHRNGPVGKVDLLFDSEKTTFRSVEKSDFGDFTPEATVTGEDEQPF